MAWVRSGPKESYRVGSGLNASGRVRTGMRRNGGSGRGVAVRTAGPGPGPVGAEGGGPMAGVGGSAGRGRGEGGPSTALSAGVRGGGGAPRAGAAAEGGGGGADRRSPPAPGRGHRRLLLLESHRAAGEGGRAPSLEAHPHVGSGRGAFGMVSCKERHRLETFLARSLKRYLSRSLFFPCLQKKKKKAPPPKKNHPKPKPIIIIFTGCSDGASWKHIY